MVTTHAYIILLQYVKLKKKLLTVMDMRILRPHASEHEYQKNRINPFFHVK